MAFPGLTEPLEPYDPDPWVRLAQVRSWISGGRAGFYDHSVHNADAPFGGATTPWTRPLDALLALFYAVTPHQLAMNVRLMLAATWLPLCLGLGWIALQALAVRRHFDNLHALGYVALLALFTPDIYYYFMAGDSDHHGLLSMLWCGVLAQLMLRDFNLKAAGVAGLLLGLMIWISPEALMITAAAYAVLGAEALWRPARMGLLAATATGAALAATFGLFIEVPPEKIFTQLTYDSLSIVQVALLWLCAAGTAALAGVFQKPLSFAQRFLAASVAGSAVLLAMRLLYPRFYEGPLAGVDSFILTNFLPRIGEAKTLFSSTVEDMIRELMEPALALALLGITLRARHVREERYHRLLTLAALLLVTGIMTLWQVRWAYYMHPPAIIMIAISLAGITAMPKTRPLALLRHLPRQWRPYIVLWLCFLLTNILVRFNPAVPTEAASCLTQMRYVIQTQQLPPLLRGDNLVLFAPEDSGGDLLFFTNYRIIASNYHREGAGLKDMDAIAKAREPAEALPLLRKRQVGAMLYCPNFYDRASWLRQVTNDKLRPKWLTPVSGLSFMDTPGKRPVLFRVTGGK